MGKPFEFFEHTADVKFKAYGKSLEECFSNAVLATTAVIYDKGDVKESVVKSVNVRGADLKSLLYNFLEEIIFLICTEFYLPARVLSLKIVPVSDVYMLSATITGDFMSNGYSAEGDIKAPTYNEMKVTENYVQVVLDI